MNRTKYITADFTKCRNCGLCRCKTNCPKNVIGKAGGFWRKRTALLDPDECNGCMKCTKSCIRHVFAAITEEQMKDRTVSRIIVA